MDAHRDGAAVNLVRVLAVALLAIGGAVTAARARAVTTDEPARRPPPSTDILGGAQEGTVVFDGDGGKAEIVPRTPLVPRPPVDHGGPVIERPFLRLIFLGSGWRGGGDVALARERLARELGSRHAMAERPLEDFEDPAGALRDLEVQRRLDAQLRYEEWPSDPGEMFVVAAAPGLEVRLGESSSARDFAAYHNWFHRESGVVRYVVVPYDADTDRWLAAARRAVEQTVRNPEGNGWY